MVPDNKHPEIKQAFYHLDICCRYVGEKYGHAIISEWTNSDYIKLSGQLSRQTDVQISPNTLKRIFGKLKTNDRYYPQKATRDTLARYTGFEDWEHFVQKHPRPESGEMVTEKVPDNIPPVENKKKREIQSRKLWWLALLTIAALLITLFFLTKKDHPGSFGIAGTTLICVNPEGANPHSAIFRIQLSPDFKGDADNFTLNFADGRGPKKISASKALTHYYEIPGRYYPVLIYDGKPLDTVSVYLRTNGWTATANMQNDSVRVYPLPDQIVSKDHFLRVNTKELFHSGVDTNRTFFVHFVNARPMEISGDNFELTTDVRTSSERAGVRCSQVNVSIFGETSKHLFRVMKPGCSSFTGIQLSENIVSGESEDLSNLGMDLSKGGHLKFQVRNQQGKLWINDKMVFQGDYKIPVGTIYGIEILFSGIGDVSNIQLKDLKTGKTFKDGIETAELP